MTLLGRGTQVQLSHQLPIEGRFSTPIPGGDASQQLQYHLMLFNLENHHRMGGCPKP